MTKLLFLYADPYFAPKSIPTRGKFELLSKRQQGVILNVATHEAQDAETRLGAFRLELLALPVLVRQSTWLRNLSFLTFGVLKAVYLHYRSGPFRAVVATEPMVTGLAALAIRFFTGARVIVEVNGQFETAFTYDSATLGWRTRLKHRYALTVIPFVLRAADAVKLLYPQQMESFPVRVRPKATFAFPNFVSTSRFHEQPAKPYILFLGFPWYLKGVDLLIKAFRQVSQEFPDYRLKIVGYCDDRAPFEALAAGHSGIDLCGPAQYEEVVELMAQCALFVLPSRTEGIARVLSEAMAARKPIVASNVGGIPSIIKDGLNGLLFESENVGDLAAKLRRVLGDRALARALADRGEKFVRSELSEAKYLDRFSAMVTTVVSGEHVSSNGQGAGVAPL